MKPHRTRPAGPDCLGVFVGKCPVFAEDGHAVLTGDSSDDVRRGAGDVQLRTAVPPWLRRRRGPTRPLGSAPPHGVYFGEARPVLRLRAV
eukprot:CAMPEP_0175588276 /NCGR_PEP_ID=MMETSP0096-20121207/51202_1 /TAXON_ID=311494 /ORGANISM="Alexandrium monilatum, Strain CCMP3105" /LENGTH=89 /DNA_ID=CAMNT_0016892241 /DNA_START=110 /DNA_END=376 /DNA_ORIENTATION=+